MKNLLAPRKILNKSTRSPLDIRSYFDDRKGIFQCKKKGCLTCQFIVHGSKIITTNLGKNYGIRQFITCSTDFVIYVLRGLFYVGCTIRALCARIGDHRRFITKRCNEHSVPQHFHHFRNKDIKFLEVFVIETIPKGTTNEIFHFM